MNVSTEEIEKDPRAYLHRVLEGETVVVFEKDQPVAEMRPLSKRTGKRPMGLAKGDFVVPDDFDDPLSFETGHSGSSMVFVPPAAKKRK